MNYFTSRQTIRSIIIAYSVGFAVGGSLLVLNPTSVLSFVLDDIGYVAISVIIVAAIVAWTIVSALREGDV